MSVINRMLADLEQREAPAARRPDALAAAGSRPRRRRPGVAIGRLLPPALALALVAVAAVLWLQRGPQLLAWLAAVNPIAPAADGPPAQADAAPAGAPGDGLAGPALVGLEFTGEGGAARLALVFDGTPDGRPRYVRSGSQLSLRVAARPDEATVPAPPGDQSVFRALSLEEAPGRGMVVRVDVAEDARFEVLDEGRRLVLVGERPAVVTPGPAAAAVGPRQAAVSGEAARDSTARGDAAAGDDAPADDASGAAPTDPALAASGADDGATAAPAGAHGSPAAEPGAGSVRKVERTTPAVRAQRRYRAAREALSAGEITAARARLRAALEADADLHGARELLAALLRRAGDASAARDVLAQGLERAPARPGFAKPYARLLVDSGELERAAQALEPAATAAAGDPGYHALVAAIAQRLGRHAQAASAYTRALEIDAGHGRWWLGLGISLAATDHPGEALAAFREARAVGDLTPRLDSWARGRMEALGDNTEG